MAPKLPQPYMYAPVSKKGGAPVECIPEYVSVTKFRTKTGKFATTGPALKGTIKSSGLEFRAVLRGDNYKEEYETALEDDDYDTLYKHLQYWTDIIGLKVREEDSNPEKTKAIEKRIEVSAENPEYEKEMENAKKKCKELKKAVEERYEIPKVSRGGKTSEGHKCGAPTQGGKFCQRPVKIEGTPCSAHDSGKVKVAKKSKNSLVPNIVRKSDTKTVEMTPEELEQFEEYRRYQESKKMEAEKESSSTVSARQRVPSKTSPKATNQRAPSKTSPKVTKQRVPSKTSPKKRDDSSDDEDSSGSDSDDDGDQDNGDQDNGDQLESL